MPARLENKSEPPITLNISKRNDGLKLQVQYMNSNISVRGKRKKRVVGLGGPHH